MDPINPNITALYLYSQSDDWHLFKNDQGQYTAVQGSDVPEGQYEEEATAAIGLGISLLSPLQDRIDKIGKDTMGEFARSAFGNEQLRKKLGTEEQRAAMREKIEAAERTLTQEKTTLEQAISNLVTKRVVKLFKSLPEIPTTSSTPSSLLADTEHYGALSPREIETAANNLKLTIADAIYMSSEESEIQDIAVVFQTWKNKFPALFEKIVQADPNIEEMYGVIAQRLPTLEIEISSELEEGEYLVETKSPFNRERDARLANVAKAFKTDPKATIKKTIELLDKGLNIKLSDNELIEKRDKETFVAETLRLVAEIPNETKQADLKSVILGKSALSESDPSLKKAAYFVNALNKQESELQNKIAVEAFNPVLDLLDVLQNPNNQNELLYAAETLEAVAKILKDQQREDSLDYLKVRYAELIHALQQAGYVMPNL